jgi:hypothetical protein
MREPTVEIQLTVRAGRPSAGILDDQVDNAMCPTAVSRHQSTAPGRTSREPVLLIRSLPQGRPSRSKRNRPSAHPPSAAVRRPANSTARPATPIDSPQGTPRSAATAATRPRRPAVHPARARLNGWYGLRSSTPSTVIQARGDACDRTRSYGRCCTSAGRERKPLGARAPSPTIDTLRSRR